MLMRPGQKRGFEFSMGFDGKIMEGETFMCQHCNAHTRVSPFQRAEDIGGFCRQCGGLLCPKCAATGLCDPLERKLDRWERQGAA